jgi:serine/threonine protein kinase
MSKEYPYPGDYNMAVWNLESAIQTDHFRGGVPKKIDSELVSYKGGYSIVYPIDLKTTTVGLRCWIREIKLARSLYKQARNALQESRLPYFVKFDYIEEAIEVNKKIWPALYMEWADGLQLNRFLDHHIHEPDQVNNLANIFAEMVESLHSHKISHGDLQDGNIIISNTNSPSALQLIDYDTLYCPEFREIPRTLAGVAGFQHPQRSKKSIDPNRVDYFSELVIYLSLRAYAKQPELWSTGQSEQLLFSEQDLQNPERSSVFNKISILSPEISYLTSRLKEFCAETNLNNLEPLEKVLSEQKNIVWVKELDILFKPKPVQAEQKERLVNQPTKTSTTEALDKIFQHREVPKKSQPSGTKRGNLPPKNKPSTTDDGWILWVIIAIIFISLCFFLFAAGLN